MGRKKFANELNFSNDLQKKRALSSAGSDFWFHEFSLDNNHHHKSYTHFEAIRHRRNMKAFELAHPQCSEYSTVNKNDVSLSISNFAKQLEAPNRR